MLGIAVRSGRASATPAGEAALRDARWTFLRTVASTLNATVCTAHTRDDQIETVLMRALRDAGPRGLAALFADGPILRPLLDFSRAELERYAGAMQLSWVEDPSNASRAYLRNRLRHDLLPALRRANPGIDRELLSIAVDAAAWRREIESLLDGMAEVHVLASGSGVDVDLSVFDGQTRSAAAALWPAIAARAGATLDRRGIARLAAFTINGRAGARVPLSGGWLATRSRDAIRLRRSATVDGEPTATQLRLSDGARIGDWTFSTASEPGSTAWSAQLPNDAPLTVRAWRAGDTMGHHADGRPRKVKELLSRAGVTGHHRPGWPVVLSGDEIVWVPGVRRVDAASARSGRPGLTFLCEYINR
jgi:tRNA(Ile)-lysidine synthase